MSGTNLLILKFTIYAISLTETLNSSILHSHSFILLFYLQKPLISSLNMPVTTV